jgi:hypothetical protein
MRRTVLVFLCIASAVALVHSQGVPTCQCDSPLVTGENPCCTYTIGWWLNHNKYESANGNRNIPWPTGCAYLPLGEGSILFGGLTALAIMEAAPQGGDKCYGLGHQFIAAAMNACRGACINERVGDVLESAYALLTTPGLCPGGLGLGPQSNVTLRNLAVQKEDTLEGYNSGDSDGPGHCGDEILDECPKYDCDGGCTYTQGYWKTHNAAIPARKGRTDPAWCKLPESPTSVTEDKILFGTYTWLSTLTTPPAGGEACLIAGKQYVAARLNIECKDACLPNDAVRDALSCVSDILAGPYCPGLAPGLGKLTAEQNATRTELLSCAGTLDAYNNGYLLGPGHCDESANDGESKDTANLVEASSASPLSEREANDVAIATLSFAILTFVCACVGGWYAMRRMGWFTGYSPVAGR